MGVTPIVFGGFPDYLEPQFAAATVSGSADAGHPITYLRRRELYLKARLTSTADWTISWAYGGDIRDISAVALIDHNFPSGTTVQVLLYPTGTFTVGSTTPIYDSGELDAFLPVSTDFVSSESFAWGDFEWGGASPEDRVLALPRNFIHLIMQAADSAGIRRPNHISCGGGALVIRNLSTAASAYAHAGMLMTTKLWQPSRNFRWNWKVKMIPLGDPPVLSRYGRRWGRSFGALREMGMTLDLLTRGEILDFPWTFSYDRTWASPLLVVPEPDTPEYWWANAGVWSIVPNNLFEMEARPTLAKLWDLGAMTFQDWR